jgi:Domain of unknown function (DUF932)
VAHEIMIDSEGKALALFASGDGKVKGVWHQSITGSTVLDVSSLDPQQVPSGLLPAVYTMAPLDPETLDPCRGLSLIKAEGFPQRLGVAGGHKRTCWQCAQPREILASMGQLMDLGATLEGVFWLAPGRFYVEGALPVDEVTREVFGEDEHDVRYCAVADLTGGGRDFIMVSVVRVVCANTSAVARYDANQRGSVLRIGHSAGVSERWRLDVPAFLADYSGKLRAHADKLQALNTKKITVGTLLSYFQAVVGEKPKGQGRSATLYERKLVGLRQAWRRERAHAREVGIPQDSARVAYEAVTNLANHGALVADSDQERGDDGWRSPINTARTATGRALALADGSISGPALSLALAL